MPLRMANVEENTNIIKVQKKRGRKPQLNPITGEPLTIEEKNSVQETPLNDIMKIIMNTENFKNHVGVKEKQLKKND